MFEGKTICAVVVTWNRLELLKHCLNGILENRYVDHIVVVDNDSSDGTSSYLASLDPTLFSTLRLPSNIGGAGGFHEGLRESYMRGFDLLWIMDDDATPNNDCLEALCLASSELDWDYGYLASNVFSIDGHPMNTPVIDERPALHGYPNWTRHLGNGLVAIRGATFVSMIIPRSVLKEVGLPIKEMFLWGDDSEYTQRISNAHPAYLVGRSNVIHYREAQGPLSVISEKSTARIDLYYYYYRNLVYRLRKHEGIKRLTLALISIPVTMLQIFIHSPDNRFARLSIVTKGVLGGLIFNPPIRHPDSRS